MATTTRTGRVERKRKDQVAGLDDWDAWVAHLAARKPFIPFADYSSSVTDWPLLWPLSSEFSDSDAAELVAFLARWKPSTSTTPSLVRRLEQWLERVEGRDQDAALAMECLAWTLVLPQLTAVLPRAHWCQLLDSLLAVVERSSRFDLMADPLTYFLFRGELPWLLSRTFPELATTAALGEAAKATLSDAILELLDGEGLPHSRFWSQFRAWLACWTRCMVVGRVSQEACFTEEAAAQFAWLVRESVRFSRRDGTIMLGETAIEPGRWTLLQTALVMLSSELDQQLAATVWPRRSDFNAKSRPARASKGTRAVAGKSELPAPAVHSEWAAAAMLRRSWTPTEPSLAITWGRRQVDFELSVQGQTMLSGGWDYQIELDGQRLQPIDDYVEVCWVSDEDVSYLELEVQLTGDCRLQRQILLTQDRFVLLADAVLGNQIAELQYRSTLPLSPGVEFVAEAETSEGILKARRPLTVVLPLDLSEWRVPPRGQSLEQTSAGLQLQRRSRTTRMFNALFLDVDPSRIRQPRTWRQLTVAQRLERQADDVAVGYRVQIGLQQWLFYRSLAAKANRTVLGQNFNTDFVAARFFPNGTIHKLLEIE